MRTAIVIGISNYEHPDLLPMLPGCLNDVDDMVAYLHEILRTDPSAVLRDGQATRQAIMDALSAGIAALQRGDELIVHYSGHGAPFPQRNAVHDAICPFDFDWDDTKVILDTDVAALFPQIPNDARLSIIADSCYSGGLAQNFAMLQGIAAAPEHVIRTIPVPLNIAAEIAALRGAADVTFESVAARGNVVLLAACLANLTAADAVFGDRANGAMTFNLLNVLRSPAPPPLPPTAKALISRVKAGLVRFSQTPQLHGREALFSTPFMLA